MSEQTNGFFTKEETDQIVDAIVAAEKRTSGEIRVHIEQTKVDDSSKRVVEVFEALKMHETKQRNGVLFYIGIKDHSFFIIGDKGINDLVGADFWDKTKDMVIDHFKNGAMKEGLVKGIEKVGEKLSVLYPYQGSEHDEDELSNEISGNHV